MIWIEFCRDWIAKNIPNSGVYGSSIRVYVSQLAELLNKQKHSGASFMLTIHYLKKMISAYNNQHE